MNQRYLAIAVSAAAFVMGCCSDARPATREQIEADWLKQAEVRRAKPSKPVTTAADAAGAVDGITNGKYGFHTAQEAHPWWQVDLTTPTAIARIIVYNRQDYAPGLHNADNLVVLTSDDATSWTERYRHNGTLFGGFNGKDPLIVSFKDGELRARYVRLQLPDDEPMYLHLDEVEVYAASDPAKNIALGKPADQSSLSQWSTCKLKEESDTEAGTFPTEDFIARARRLAADLRNAGVDTTADEHALSSVKTDLARLAGNASAATSRDLYLRTRRIMRHLAFSNPLLDFDNMIFVKRFTQETYPDVCLNHMPWVSRPGGDICVLNDWKSEGEAQIRTLINRALGPGHVHGMDLWWDGTRVVFGFARAKSDAPVPGFPGRIGHATRLAEEPTHIFEIGVDGKGLRQLTYHSLWSDLDPTYLPSGDIAFVSERCGASLQCNEMDKDETSCNLYVMHSDGKGIKRLSVTKDGDYLPHTLDDGTIGYTRWEYQERGWANVQAIWTVRPDGTGADAVFKQHFNNPWALEETRSIPGSTKLVAIATGHHTLPAGPVVVIDPALGINNTAGIGIVTPGVKPPEGGMSGEAVPGGGVFDRGGFYMQPWALSEKYFLASYCYGDQTDRKGYALYLIDVFGSKELIYRDPKISCFVPTPLRPRPRPPILPDTTNPSKDYAVCTLTNVAQGVPGVDPKQMRYLRISEGVMWPYDGKYGGQRYEPDAKGTSINWTPVRVIGTVPIEPDGSAHFRVPADTAVYFQLLDENQMDLRRMRSFISFQPGEVRGCTGCHETRGETPHYAIQSNKAVTREASAPLPPPWGSKRAVSFLRDIQPVLDRNCVQCHSGMKPAGGMDLFSGLTAARNTAFESIERRRLVSRSNVHEDSTITMPLMFGSHRSSLLEILRKEPHARKVALDEQDRLRLVTWIDANAPYDDGFINKRVTPPPYVLPTDKELLARITAVHQRRCASCHESAAVSRLSWIDVRDPEQSLFLKAPLAKQAGGTAKCGQTVYADANDADYSAVLQLVKQAVENAWAAPRRDVKALVEDRQQELKQKADEVPALPSQGIALGPVNAAGEVK